MFAIFVCLLYTRQVKSVGMLFFDAQKFAVLAINTQNYGD